MFPYYPAHLLHCNNPSSGPVPPSPYLVNTVPPAQTSGRPTPPPSPPRPPATPSVHGDGPCPPTPRCVPEDDRERSNASISSTLPHDDSCVSELDDSTDATDSQTDDEAQDDDPRFVNASDHIIYDPDTYASPSPVLIMMQRAHSDMCGLESQPVNLFGCDLPVKLFTLSGGHTPRTGIDPIDRQSLKYYAIRPYPSVVGQPESPFTYCYPTDCLEAVQRSLRSNWSLVFPEPIPPIIIRLRDLVGPHSLGCRSNGYAFVVPTDPISSAIRQRGIDSEFRPIHPFAHVATWLTKMGDAVYCPQHIVASKFAVNVFLELDDPATGPNVYCTYLGAFILQVMDGITLNRAVWEMVDPIVRDSILDRIPDHFKGFKHWPQLPYVRFCYYKWDESILGMADKTLANILFPQRRSVDQADYLNSSNAGPTTSQHAPTINVYTTEYGPTSLFGA